jgi:septin family protein
MMENVKISVAEPKDDEEDTEELNSNVNQWWKRESVMKLESPFTAIVCGCSQSGKSSFVRKVMENKDNMFTKKTDRIVYCYNELEPAMVNMQEKRRI